MGIESKDAFRGGVPPELREQLDRLSVEPDPYFWAEIDVAPRGERSQVRKVPFTQAEVTAIRDAAVFHRQIVGAIDDSRPGDGPKEYFGSSQFPLAPADLLNRRAAVEGVLMSARAARSVLARGGFGTSGLHVPARKIKELPSALGAHRNPHASLRRAR